MDFVTAVKSCFSKYVTFSGRAQRSEYWWFVLFAVLVGIVTSLIDMMLFSGMMQNGTSPVNLIASLAMILPGLSVTVRRLHDLGKSGWWYFLILVPLIGALVLIWWFATKFDEGPNQYGPDPLAS